MSLNCLCVVLKLRLASPRCYRMNYRQRERPTGTSLPADDATSCIKISDPDKEEMHFIKLGKIDAASRENGNAD